VAEPVLATKMPDGWVTAPQVDSAVFASAQSPAGLVVMAAVLLEDGTNIYTVTWPTGQRVARTCHATHWAIEERFDGEQPTDDDDVRVRMWRMAIEAMVKAGQDTRAELGGRSS
jgi:hypothetical protein